VKGGRPCGAPPPRQPCNSWRVSFSARGINPWVRIGWLGAASPGSAEPVDSPHGVSFAVDVYRWALAVRRIRASGLARWW